MRTDRDTYTRRGTIRIYCRDGLLRKEDAVLHVTGEWYAEPASWKSAQPAQPGYPTLREALIEAQFVEDLRELVRHVQRVHHSLVSDPAA